MPDDCTKLEFKSDHHELSGKRVLSSKNDHNIYEFEQRAHGIRRKRKYFYDHDKT